MHGGISVSAKTLYLAKLLYMRLFIPIVLGFAFIGYVGYLAIVKKELRKSLHGVVFPGLFFIGIWAILYYFMLG